MKTNLKNYALLIVMITALRLGAQDIHFSQYNEAPLLVSPALSGVSYNYRASVLYKDQWRSVTVPYVTYGGSFEARLKLKAWEKAF